MFLIVGGDSEIGAAAYRAVKAQGKCRGGDDAASRKCRI